MGAALRKGVSTADTEYGIALLDGDSGDYWELNPTGATVLRVLLSGGSPDDAIEQITTDYSIDRAIAEQDVTELVGELRASGLLVFAGGAR